MGFQPRKGALTAQLLLLALVIPIACHKAETPATKVFATPDDAGDAVQAAVKAGDRDTLMAIFGPGSQDVIYSGDPVEDKNNGTAFAGRYSVMHRWRKMPDGSQVLVVGADNFPFPIPLKKNNDGQWFFDTAAGKDEILNRRIGRNELAVIDVCGAVADAQAEYFAEKHGGVKQYAQKFISDAGQQNGLYWPEVAGQPKSPLGPLAADATAEGYKADPNHHQPFHGYYFAMLDKQGANAGGGAKDYIADGKMTGGFAVVAYPAKYGNSGIMTFMVNQDGVIVQKDLGQTTEQVASAMTAFNPDQTWTVAK
ncbi:MAG TPA: DUF2950 domain-containing protein [Terracidiphilus sp.]|nr:DUF2950 domain-containing protein [Terracidiphilus sp.]